MSKAPEIHHHVHGRSAWKRWLESIGVHAAILLFNAIFIGVMWYAVIGVMRVDRDNTIHAAVDRNDNLAIAFEHYAIRTIESADAVTQYLALEYTRSGRKMDLLQFVADHAVDNTVLTGVVLVDEHGNGLTTATGKGAVKLNVADREHFTVHLERDSGKVFIGKPVAGRVTGKAVIPITRRINKADGTFGGVAMALIEPARFTDLLRDARTRPLEIISLVGLDGITRARLRGAAASSGEYIGKSRLFTERAKRPTGNYFSKGQLDGVPRFFSYRTLADYQIMATVGAAESDVMAEFYQRQTRYFWAAGLASVAIVGFSVLLMIAWVLQRRTAADMVRSQARFHSTFHQAAVGISLTALDDRILQANQKLCDIVGYPEQELLRLTLQEITHPEDLAQSVAYRSLIAAGQIIAAAHEKRYLRKDGIPIWVAVATTLVCDAHGAPDYFVNTIEDISARKRAEESLKRERALLRAVVDAIPERIYVKDREGRFLLQNATNLKVRGITNHDDIVNKTVFDIFPREIAERLHAEDQAAMESGVPLLNREGTTVFGSPSLVNDQTHWHLTSKIPLKDEAGKVYGLVGVNRDITDRKQAEAALLRLNEELEDKVTARTADLERARHEAEAANEAKSSFLAAMSHEIRTPMNGVVGMIDVLHQSSLRGDQVEMVKLIRESAFSLLGIIEDILDFSKIEAGKLELDREAIAVADVVDSVCSLLNGMAEKKEVALTLYVDPAIPSEVLGDALRLRQVLINLANNAIKFSCGQLHAGRVSLRALLVEQSAEQVTVEFRVTDNGIGMDEETQARLFSAFTQADVSTTRRFGGTGLGLVIANNLVELMGGEITIQSAQGEGAIFKVRLPFVRAPAKPGAVEVTSEVAGLSCIVVGSRGGLADDLAIYLEYANAVVERAPDLASAGMRSASSSGLSVWVVDAGDERQSPEQIRAAAHAKINQDVRLVVVLIERGKRRRPRMVAPDMITVDGNSLNRRTFLKAVTAAAGRASLEPEDAKLPSVKLTAIAPSRETALRQGRLILIAEDNETNQKVIVRQLALLGYTADVAADGRDALERWRSGDYALLITDLHMPHMDGYELTQAIRAEEKDGRRMPIIALTANALKGEAEICRAAGMDDYRSKPAPLVELKSVLDKWLPVAKCVPEESALSGLPKPTVPQAAGVVPVDVKVLKGLVGDGPALVHEFLQDFRASAAKITAELHAACAAGQTKAAVAAAHKLKSSARAVGALALGDLCAAMEEEGKTGNSDALIVLLPRFEAEMTVVENYLDTYANLPVEVV